MYSKITHSKPLLWSKWSRSKMGLQITTPKQPLKISWWTPRSSALLIYNEGWINLSTFKSILFCHRMFYFNTTIHYYSIVFFLFKNLYVSSSCTPNCAQKHLHQSLRILLQHPLKTLSDEIHLLCQRVP